MSDFYEYDINGDGVQDTVEVTEDSDGHALIAADLDGDGQADVAAYDADGDGQVDTYATPQDAAPDYSADNEPAETNETSEPAASSGSAPTYSQWAADQNYHDAYVNSVYGNPNEW